MSFTMDLGEWNSIFAVPSAVVDKHLKTASEAQLKTLLYLLKNSGTDIDENTISKASGVSVEEIHNALDFWLERGLIKRTGDVFIPNEGTNQKAVCSDDAQKTENKKQTVVSRAVRPDTEFVNRLIKDDKSLAGLLEEAQSVLKKPLSPGDTATLVMLYNTYGLPCEVLAMLLNFVASIGTPTMRVVEKYGLSWSDNDVFTVEAAEREIERIASSREAWKRVSAIMGLHNAGNPTAAQMTNAERWLVTWGFSDEMILEAYESCVNKKGEYNMSYINGILKKWYEKKIFSIDASRADQASSKRPSGKRTGKGSVFSEEGASFDVSQYESASLFDD